MIVVDNSNINECTSKIDSSIALLNELNASLDTYFNDMDITNTNVNKQIKEYIDVVKQNISNSITALENSKSRLACTYE